MQMLVDQPRQDNPGPESFVEGEFSVAQGGFHLVEGSDGKNALSDTATADASGLLFSIVQIFAAVYTVTASGGVAAENCLLNSL
jgi:hypothetical protein